MIFGYARVSTAEQDNAMQMTALNNAGVDEIISDKMSGTKKDRPGLERLLDKAREGDVIVVWRLDRLGRSMSNLLELVALLSERNITLKSLHENIDFSTANGRLQLHLFMMLAEFERSLLQERVMAGLAQAKAEGRVGGRPKSMTEEQLAMAKALVEAGHSKGEIAKQMNISRSTLYRNLETV
jgi:DNA invertase Pin-like site-specific DNA recombinase